MELNIQLNLLTQAKPTHQTTEKQQTQQSRTHQSSLKLKSKAPTRQNFI